MSDNRPRPVRPSGPPCPPLRQICPRLPARPLPPAPGYPQRHRPHGQTAPTPPYSPTDGGIPGGTAPLFFQVRAWSCSSLLLPLIPAPVGLISASFRPFPACFRSLFLCFAPRSARMFRGHPSPLPVPGPPVPEASIPGRLRRNGLCRGRLRRTEKGRTPDAQSNSTPYHGAFTSALFAALTVSLALPN